MCVLTYFLYPVLFLRISFVDTILGSSITEENMFLHFKKGVVDEKRKIVIN